MTGLIERHGGTSSLEGLGGGLLKTAPLLALLFFVPAMNLGGIPPLSGFIGKVGPPGPSADYGGWLVWVTMAVGGILTSLLTDGDGEGVEPRVLGHPAREAGRRRG